MQYLTAEDWLYNRFHWWLKLNGACATRPESPSRQFISHGSSFLDFEASVYIKSNQKLFIVSNNMTIIIYRYIKTANIKIRTLQ